MRSGARLTFLASAVVLALAQTPAAPPATPAIDLPADADIPTLQTALCSACDHVWLDARWSSGSPQVRLPVASCFDVVNQTCSDCYRDVDGRCSAAYFQLYPQPISGAFQFCSGHSATSAESMSTVAWMRLMCALPLAPLVHQPA